MTLQCPLVKPGKRSLLFELSFEMEIKQNMKKKDAYEMVISIRKQRRTEAQPF